MSLMIDYLNCFPKLWKSRICYHWQSRDEPMKNHFGISSESGTLTWGKMEMEEVVTFLSKQFTVLREEDVLYIKNLHGEGKVFLLCRKSDFRGNYLHSANQRCSTRGFITLRYLNQTFLQPKKFRKFGQSKI